MPDRKISAETPLSAPQNLSKMRVALFHEDGTPNDAVMTLEQVLLSPSAIDINTGSIAASAIGLRIQQTWTGTGTYNAPLLVNIPTDSGPSNAASKLLDLQIGGSSQCSIGKGGRVFSDEFGRSSGGAVTTMYTSNYFVFNRLGVKSAEIRDSYLAVLHNSAAVYFGALADAALQRHAANTLAIRNGTDACHFHVNETWGGSGANFSRGVFGFRDSAGAATTTLRIGTEAGGSGTARDLALITDGTARLTIGTTGIPSFASDQIRVTTAKTPSSASDTGVTGSICWDASYIYVAVGTNQWKRAAIATW